uniref:Uncharacterized protein n=1 Tax=Meloidogyne enterolobii TaxID=390850 RepID=A0A6V7UZU2_MELEN|nr:unnamed protein product [Meloidogyne enterolobii]
MNGQHHHAHSNLLEYDPVFGLSTQQQLTAASLDVGGTLATLTAFSASSVANSPMDYTVIAGEFAWKGKGRFLFLMALTNGKHGGGLEEYGKEVGKEEDGKREIENS